MKKILPILVLILIINGCSSKNPIDKLYNEGVERIDNVETIAEVKEFYLKELKEVYDKSADLNEDEYNKQLSAIVLKYEDCGSKLSDVLNHVWINNYDMVNITGAEMNGVHGFLLSDKGYKVSNDSISGKARYFSTFLNGFANYKVGFDCKINIKYDDKTDKGTFLDASNFSLIDNHLVVDVNKIENKKAKKADKTIQFRQADEDFNLEEEAERIK